MGNFLWATFSGQLSLGNFLWATFSGQLSLGNFLWATYQQRSVGSKDTIMKLRIKLERQKISRGHQVGRAEVVQADQRSQRERDRGARKRAILRRELDER